MIRLAPWRRLGIAALVYILGLGGIAAQTAPKTPASPPKSPFHIIPLPALPTITPGQLTLLELEGRFAADVAKGGGKAFATWFADDAVALNNGQPAIRGGAAIAASATWDPKDYSLTWVAEGAQMSSAADMGYTWGHYQGVSRDAVGHQTIKTGRYMTVWKKQVDGQWKVALDASADLPAVSPLP